MTAPKPRLSRKKKPPKPSCATCWHYEPENEQGGACMGVAPKAFMKANEQVVGAFPPVKATSRCPNWKAAQ